VAFSISSARWPRTLAAIRQMWKVAVLTSALETLGCLGFALFLSVPNAEAVIAFILLSPFFLLLVFPFWLLLASEMYASLVLAEACCEGKVWLSTIVSALAGFVVPPFMVLRPGLTCTEKPWRLTPQSRGTRARAARAPHCER
jgi:hypothetical protein